jgi:hypothetical protein
VSETSALQHSNMKWQTDDARRDSSCVKTMKLRTDTVHAASSPLQTGRRVLHPVVTSCVVKYSRKASGSGIHVGSEETDRRTGRQIDR